MGFLRFLLATSVVIFHASPIFGFHMVHGILAVYAFFIVSGFYMSLILHKKYVKKNSSYLLFVSNRFLRIYPIYWIGLFTLLAAMLVKFFFFESSDLTLTNYIAYYVHQPLEHAVAGILGDVLRNLTLILTSDYVGSNPQAPLLLLIPQSWTLQLELLFYLIAPFLFRGGKKRLFITLFCIGIVHTILSVLHLTLPNTLFWMFMNHVMFFLLGGVSYLLYVRLTDVHIPKNLLVLLYCIVLFFISTFNTNNYLGLQGILETSVFAATTMLFLPFAFLLSQQNRFDHWLGELSYPMYIMHSIVIKLLQSSQFFMSNYSFFTISALALTIGISILLVILLEAPIDKFRQRRLAVTKS